VKGLEQETLLADLKASHELLIDFDRTLEAPEEFQKALLEKQKEQELETRAQFERVQLERARRASRPQ
jgi:hypothetical protein